MKVLVLGAYGMLGHKVLLELNHKTEVRGTCRRIAIEGLAAKMVPADLLYSDVDAEHFDGVARVISEASPDVVVNCIGIVKQLEEAKDPVRSICVNSLFPHLLSSECVARGIRLVHFSTDCVFSGKKGMYTEDDNPDPVDLYGRTKLVGEVSANGCITIRSSLVGRELGSANGLIEWFLRNRGGKVKGYRDAVFSGLTTTEMSRVVLSVLTNHSKLSGVWHIASKPISKYDLLRLVNVRMRLGTEIEEDTAHRIDRSLDGGRFQKETEYIAPSWEEMVDEMASEAREYAPKLSDER